MVPAVPGTDTAGTGELLPNKSCFGCSVLTWLGSQSPAQTQSLPRGEGAARSRGI